MKSIKYLNAVLTIIAFCLCAITASLVGIIPTASAKDKTRFATVPVNPDGSILVRFPKSETLDVNIDEIGGGSLSYKTLPVDIEEVNGNGVSGGLPVDKQ